MIEFLIFFSMYPIGKTSMDAQKKRAISIFTTMFIVDYFLFANAFYFLALSKNAWVGSSLPILYFLIPLPPLLFLKQFLGRYYLDHPLLSANVGHLERFCAEHQLSDREKEIAGLLLEGKTKNEIAETLYLSPHTVRNHMASMYKKLGIKNRMQFFYLLQNSSATTPNPSHGNM